MVVSPVLCRRGLYGREVDQLRFEPAVHLLHGLDLHQALDRPVDLRVQPLYAGQRHVKFFQVDNCYKFIGLFVAGCRLPRQQALCYFGAPRVGVFTCLERPPIADGVGVEGAEGSEQGLNLLHAGGFIKFRSERAKVLNVTTGFVFLADFIQPLLDRDLLMAIEAPPGPTQIQECLDQIFLCTARGGEFQVKLSAQGIVVLVFLPPQHYLLGVGPVLERVALLALLGHELILFSNRTRERSKSEPNWDWYSAFHLWRISYFARRLFSNPTARSFRLSCRHKNN